MIFGELERWLHEDSTLAGFEDGGRGHEPRNADGLRKLENGFFFKASREKLKLPTPSF